MKSIPYSPVCDLLGCDIPIVLAGMGGVARWELVTAVTQAGGFGFLGMVREPVSLIKEQVQQLQQQGIRQFGVNLIPKATDPMLLEAQVNCCIELGVPVISLFWDIDTELVHRLANEGIKVVCQVGSAAEALQAERAGAHVLIVQGVEAGGHVRGKETLDTLIPSVLKVSNLPLLAAGGLSDGADLATMLSLGAQGIVLGTALLATRESFAHDYHKDRVIEATSDQTILTDSFHINWPIGAKVRVLKNSVTAGDQGDPFTEDRKIIAWDKEHPLYLFSTDSPLRTTIGDLEAMALYAGTGVDKLTDIVGAAERVQSIVDQSTALLESGASHPLSEIELASPVCFAGTMDYQYSDYIPPVGLLAALNELLEAERAGALSTLQTAREIKDAPLRQLILDIHRDEARWCAVLTQAIQKLNGEPSRQVGAFLEKIMSIDDLPARLTFLNRGQSWVVRRLQDLIPKIKDDSIRADLIMMLKSHEHNIRLIER